MRVGRQTGNLRGTRTSESKCPHVRRGGNEGEGEGVESSSDEDGEIELAMRREGGREKVRERGGR